VRAAAAFVTGVLLWLIPLVVISGGPAAYWHALSNQGAEDLGNITMLWTRHDVRTAIDALYYALVAPWATWPAAIIVLVCAVSGIARLWRRQRIALTLLAAGFGPYFVFDLLFQETFTGRYALPLVVPMAYLAVAGTRWLPKAAAVIVAVAIAMFDAHVGGTSIAAYARQKAPAFRLLDDMAAEPQTVPPALAMDRRNAFDFRRPIVWAGATMARVADTLPSPPQHEWLEAMRFWNRGGRGPVWFVVDPKRTAIDLVQHGGPQQYRWQLPYPVLVSGARPDQMDWYRVERPDWYVGEGWALTPEAAGPRRTHMRSERLAEALPALFCELLQGSPDGSARAYVLNQGDHGLLASLDRLSAAAASATHAGGASIASHADHLRYGFSLLNRWADGLSPPWPEMDWTASWKRTAVSEAEWRTLCEELRREATRWASALSAPRDVSEKEAGWLVGSVAHLAYHMGAIRQIDRATRGPSAEDEARAQRK